MALPAGAVALFGWVDRPALGRWARPLAVPLALLAGAVGGLVIAAARLTGAADPSDGDELVGGGGRRVRGGGCGVGGDQ